MQIFLERKTYQIFIPGYECLYEVLSEPVSECGGGERDVGEKNTWAVVYFIFRDMGSL